jgi:hypothetical protein
VDKHHFQNDLNQHVPWDKVSVSFRESCKVSIL